MSAQLALQLRNMSKTFSGHTVLTRFNLDVEVGEIHALAGQNGSGKSTVIKILSGYHKSDPGASATAYGSSFELGSSAGARHAGLRFVHQDLGLVPTMSVMENVLLAERAYPQSFGRIQWRRAQRLAEAAVERAGLQVDVRRPAGELGLANQTLVAIARALLGTTDHSTLVLDEPTAALPLQDVDTLFSSLRALAGVGTSVLIVSHHIEEVLEIGDRITVLRSGLSLGTRRVADTSHDEIVRLIVGSDVASAQRATEAERGREAVLEASGIRGGLLTDFDVRVGRGEVVGVAGLTGSGRESLGPLLAGGDHREGSVRIAGAAVRPDRPSQAIRAGMATVFGDRARYGVIPTLAVRHNLTLSHVGRNARRGRISHKRERRETVGWIDSLSIVAQGPDATMSSLSGGNQQKVLIARALRLRPKVLLLDDPTAGIDVGARAQVHEVVERAVEDLDLGVLLISTDSNELARLCDRVLVMARGRIGAELIGAELTATGIDRALLTTGTPVGAQERDTNS
jgi:ribose transport system ATP-binding protein